MEKEMATHSSVLAWRIPGMGKHGGLPSLGSHRIRHDWSDLAAAAAETHQHFHHFPSLLILPGIQSPVICPIITLGSPSPIPLPLRWSWPKQSSSKSGAPLGRAAIQGRSLSPLPAVLLSWPNLVPLCSSSLHLLAFLLPFLQDAKNLQ